MSDPARMIFARAVDRLIGRVRKVRRPSPKTAIAAGCVAAALIAGAGLGASIALVAQPAPENRVEYLQLKQDATDLTVSNNALNKRLDYYRGVEDDLDWRSSVLDQREAAVIAEEADALEHEAEIVERETAVAGAEEEQDANEITGGVVVVGEDVKSGRYKTAGGELCYYAFLDGTGSDPDVISNNIVTGPSTVTLDNGDVFESNGCDAWERQ
jgi:hypothetical protein